MKHGQIIYHDGRWFRVLNQGEARSPSDWLEWSRDETPALDTHADAGAVGEYVGTVVTLRELHPLIGALMGAERKREARSNH